MPNIPKDKTICYTYIQDKNAKFLKKLSKQTGQSLSFCMDSIIDSLRKKKIDVEIPQHTPRYVKKAKEYEKRQKVQWK